ncbi:MAG: hypothetical protein AcusKO_49730 [Acuticoccus sp.]
MTTGALFAAGLTAFSVSGALAEEAGAYTVDDVVAHFKPAPDLGKARRLCIGTPSECGATEPVVEKAPFNLEVQFEFNSAALTPEAQRQLDIFAEAATGGLADARFHIDGHTDASGTERTNQRLSELRAASVVDYLVTRGVGQQRLISEGFGESRPAYADPYDGANRRVEASLSDAD